MKEMVGVELTCREVKNGRIYPTPSYTPSIYRVMLLDDGTFRVTDVITLKDRDGRPLNGMPNPLRTATTETPLDGAGKPLQQDMRGIDAEGLVVLSDGSFWIGEENAPSLAHFGADGRMIARHVPAGTEGDFSISSCRIRWPIRIPPPSKWPATPDCSRSTAPPCASSANTFTPSTIRKASAATHRPSKAIRASAK
jgi:hypothetical protein